MLTSFWGRRLLKRRYPPTACKRFISSGLRSRGTNGPVEPIGPRGGAVTSSIAFFCSRVSFSAGMKKLLFLQIALFASAVGLRAQHSFTPIDVEDGGRLYRANCS